MCADVPHPNNACSGRFANWLEIHLTPDCNGRCAWCVERHGWHPGRRAEWMTLADAAITTAKPNVILLGGEPTLHPDFREIVGRLAGAGRRVWVTTNGSRLSRSWVLRNMAGVSGVNISIHHDNLAKNAAITGIRLGTSGIARAIAALREYADPHGQARSVRFNCNCIKGAIDSRRRIDEYVVFAKLLGADCVRFAELKFDTAHFVDLADVLGHEHGLNDDPFSEGCCCDTMIDGMPVNFRQMCGMQTPLRPCPSNPMFAAPKQVLYYDGHLYDGWQTDNPKEKPMNKEDLARLLERVASGATSVYDARQLLWDRMTDATEPASTPASTLASTPAGGGGYCEY